MKIIIIPILIFLKWCLIILVGIIYSILYFIYSPKGMINEKKKCISFWKDWKQALSDEDFWCPHIMS